jgi:hypothetical protein
VRREAVVWWSETALIIAILLLVAQYKSTDEKRVAARLEVLRDCALDGATEVAGRMFLCSAELPAGVHRGVQVSYNED